MRVGIVGSRSFRSFQTLFDTLEKRVNIDDITLIVSGGAPGADHLAQKLAKDRGIPILIIYPQWKKYGNDAESIRNEKIVKSSDILFAFWDGADSETKSTIDFAEKYSIEYLVCKF